MTALSRAFLAVYPPTDVVRAVDERLGSVRALPAAQGLRWTRHEQWHLTLRFCGQVPDGRALVDAVAEALAGLDAVPGLRLVGAGAFPKARHASVLWIGLEEGEAASALEQVALATELACVSAGLPEDDRPFRPHVTVARSSRARDLRPLVAGVGPEPVGPPWTADAVVLVASETRPEGSVHEEIARFPLSG